MVTKRNIHDICSIFVFKERQILPSEGKYFRIFERLMFTKATKVPYIYFVSDFLGNICYNWYIILDLFSIINKVFSDHCDIFISW